MKFNNIHQYLAARRIVTKNRYYEPQLEANACRKCDWKAASKLAHAAR